MKQSNLKKLTIRSEDKESLELVSGQHILLKNTFDQSGAAITTLMEQAVQNAQEYLTRKKMGQKLGIYEENNLYKALLEIQKTLSIPGFPHRIECYDISHLQGTFVYGSMVVFIEGKPQKRLYRLFRTKQQNNDFENLSEVIKRRLERFLKHSADPENPWSLPDLIVIDGGKGQLGSIMKTIQEYQLLPEYGDVLKNIKICALAKKEELVFVPNSAEPVVFSGLPKFLLQRLRDETHRFGITNNRKARSKQASKSTLEDIPGIGKVTAQKLLKEFGSIENLIKQLWDNNAYVSEFVGPSAAKILAEYYQIKKTP